MKPLIETFNCDPTLQASDTSGASRWTLMTRAPGWWFVTLPRTKLFHPDNPALWGILWWRNSDPAVLGELHQLAKRICLEIGGATFCQQCHGFGAENSAFWRQALGEHHRFLRWKT